MLLSENNHIIEALKKILEDYSYLAYDQERSQGRDYLHVQVIDSTALRNEDIIHQIISALRQATGEKFMSPPIVGSGRGDSDWPFFRIRKMPSSQL